MALHLHRAERTDLLADGLGRLLVTPPADPFAEDLVLVSARGVERWLSQRLSGMLGTSPASGDGVCAGVTFRSPASLIAEIAGTPDADPWSADAMVWPLLAVIDASMDERWCAILAAHLGHRAQKEDEAELRRGRRYAVARRLAGLFASYARQRPQLLVDWLDGRATDGSGSELDDDLAWQPPLWRALVAARQAGGIDPPGVRHRAALDRLRAVPTETLPARLSLFGHTLLACTDIELLDALATHHDLHLWLPHPSDVLWQRLHGRRGPVHRRDDTGHGMARHPLLQTLGRDLRELQRALPDTACTDEYLPAATTSDATRTLLAWLQSDIAADAIRPNGRSLRPDDRSVQVHACHGPARQVDVLREVLLGLLEHDPTLEPRDIVVMCPDIETYAPLILAGFGLDDLAGDTHPAHSLRIRLADRAPAQTNPLLGVAADLLAIAGSRATASAVLDLAGAGPVRKRFALTDDDLDVVAGWVRETNIHWGFDAAHREPFGLAGVVHNTWRFGLDRILTGVAMSEDSRAWLGTALPLDDVGSNRVELAGRFAEFVSRVEHAADALTGLHTLTDWLAALTDGVTALTRVSGEEAWQLGQLHREFADLSARADRYAETALRLADVRALLHRNLAGHPTRANFRTGTLTVCTMVPMRSVPHRVVCLLGLDDRVFPRLDRIDGDDVLSRRPLTGERDVRSADRQLLLDAICAATEKLVVTYTGADQHTGEHRPPAVPLAELLDALDATVGESVRTGVLTRHPAQPFDTRNVTPGALIPDVPFTFDPTALTAGEAAAGTRRQPPLFCPAPLPAAAETDVSLADLRDFFANPVRGFFRALDYTLPHDVDGITDAMPVALNALDEWNVGERMLRDIMRGMDRDGAKDTEWRRGGLPPLRLGWRHADIISQSADRLVATAEKYQQTHADTVDIDTDLGGGRRLTGTVNQVFDDHLVAVSYSKMPPKFRLTAWVSLIALAAADSGRQWSAYCVGRSGDGNIDVRRLTAPTDSTAVLRDLVSIFDAGRREPLPLPLKTSYVWADKRLRGRNNPALAAAGKWSARNKKGESIGENIQPPHVRVWGPNASFDVLLRDPPRAGEDVPGEDTRFGALAVRLWLPMLQAQGPAR